MNTKRPASSISPGAILGLTTRNMRPEHAAHGRKLRARQAFEQARMIPEFELDDIGIARQCRDLIETLGDRRSGPPAASNRVGETAIARLLEQNKVCSHDLGQSCADAPRALCQRRRQDAA